VFYRVKRIGKQTQQVYLHWKPRTLSSVPACYTTSSQQRARIGDFTL